MPSETKHEVKTLSRRAALKSLLAASGAVVLTHLPDQWETPVVIEGTLPALAQTSPVPTPTPDLGMPPTTSNCAVNGPLTDCNVSGGQSGQIYVVTCDYRDVDGNMTPNQARVRVESEYPSGSSSIQEAALDPVNLTGDGFEGTVTLPFCINFAGEPSVTLILTFIDANGLPSDTETATISAPSPINQEVDGTPGIELTDYNP